MLEWPLTQSDINPRLLGHWGTTPGLNFIYVHLNRLIKENDLNMIFVAGPGHGGPGVIARRLSGRNLHRTIIPTSNGTTKRIASPVSAVLLALRNSQPCRCLGTPGSIHEGGELGYSLLHAYGAAFDNPDLIVACVIGDGEAETGALAASWHSNKFLNPARDGAVLPILHLNGFKIANPTVLARMPRELTDLLRGYGYEPHFVEGNDPASCIRPLPARSMRFWRKFAEIQSAARSVTEQGRTPALADDRLSHAQGLDGPKFVDGLPVEGTWRAHQVPIADFKNPEHLKQLEEWMKSYRPQELFDERGKFREEFAALAPTGHRRMGSNPHANGGELLVPLSMPHFHDYAVALPRPAASRRKQRAFWVSSCAM